MPIYIKNNLTISGDSNQMEKLLNKSHGKINFEALIPIPDGLNDEQNRLSRLGLWGTRGIMANEDSPQDMEKLNYKVTVDKDFRILSMQVEFDTSDNPPLLFFIALQELYPKLILHLDYDNYLDEKGTALTRFDNGNPYFDINEYFIAIILEKFDSFEEVIQDIINLKKKRELSKQMLNDGEESEVESQTIPDAKLDVKVRNVYCRKSKHGKMFLKLLFSK